MTGGKVRVHQQQQTNLHSLRVHLARYLISDQSAITITTQKVRSLRLHAAHHFKVGCCHLFKGWWERLLIKLVGFKQVKRLLWSLASCQFPAIESATLPFSMQVEKWRQRPSLLHHHKRCAAINLYFLVLC